MGEAHARCPAKRPERRPIPRIDHRARDSSGRATKYRIMIEHMPLDMSQEELADLASDFGKVRSAQVFGANNNSESLSGRLEFESEADMNTVIKELDNRRLEGHSLKLKAFRDNSG